MVSLLLEHDAEANCKAKNGLTPLHLAAQEDGVPVAEILVKYGSQIDSQTKVGSQKLWFFHCCCWIYLTTRFLPGFTRGNIVEEWAVLKE